MHLLEAQNVTRHFGGVVANLDINLSIEEGKTTGLIGPNGSGKTTFINQVSGVFLPTSGKILFKGMDITTISAHKRADLGIARTFQRIQLFNRMTALENVLVSRKKFMRSGFLDVVLNTKRLKREELEQYDKVMEIMELLGLKEEADRMPSNMPYGKRRALEIARALALEPALLLLDEPAAGMTKEEFKEILEIMKVLRERKVTMLLVEHTMEFIRQAVDDVYVLNFGEVIAHGSFEEIEKDPLVISAYLGDDDE